jgi:hypothetical protein
LAISWKILLSLSIFDIWTLDTLTSAKKHDRIAFHELISPGFDLDAFCLWMESKQMLPFDMGLEGFGHIYEPNFKSVAMSDAEHDPPQGRFIKSAILSSIDQTPNHALMMQLRMKFYRLAGIELFYAEKEPLSSKTEGMASWKTKMKYLAKLVLKSAEEHQRLRAIIAECEVLHNHVKYAREHGLLVEEVLVILEAVVEDLSINLDSARKLVEDAPERVGDIPLLSPHVHPPNDMTPILTTI